MASQNPETLGAFLYSDPDYKCGNTLVITLDGKREIRPFNPEIIPATPYIVDLATGRTIPNPEWRIDVHRRWGYYPEEIRGSAVGERLAATQFDFDGGLLDFCNDNSINIDPLTVPTGMAATKGKWHPFEISKYDALYCAKGNIPAWDMMFPQSLKTPTTPTAPTDLLRKISELQATNGDLANRQSEILEELEDIAESYRLPADIQEKGGGKYAAKWRAMRIEILEVVKKFDRLQQQ